MQVNFNIFNNIWHTKQAQNKQQKNTVATNPFAQTKTDSFISFKGDYCSPKNFLVKKLPNLHCPACGQIMMSDKQIEKFVNYVGAKKGQELIEALEKYEDESTITGKPSKDKSGFGVYRPFKKDIVDVYKRLAYENPNDDLLTLTKNQAKICIENLIAQQMLVIEELRAYIIYNFENEDERKALLKKIDDFEKQIKGEVSETFARKKFIAAIKNATNSAHALEIDKIVSQMPSSENDINSFFVKYSRAKSSKEIASKFVQQTAPTTEHLKPQSMGGSDSLSNYICDCEDCNNKRGTTPFYDWIQTLPDFEERLQEYVNEVRLAIDNKKLGNGDEYDTYIESIIETLEEMSEGEIILDVPEVKNPEKKAQVIKRRARQISQLKTQNEQIKEMARQFNDEISRLKQQEDFYAIYEYFEAQKELESVDEQLASLNTRIQALRAPLYEAKRDFESAQIAVEGAKDPAERLAFKKESDKKEEIYQEKETQYNALDKKIGKLQRRKISLKKIKKPYSTRIKELEEQIIFYGSIVSRGNALSEKIAKLGNYPQKIANLSAQIKQLEAEINELETKNNEIMARSTFLTTNTANYNKYCHQKDLLRVAENLLQNRNFNKLNTSANMEREVVEIGIKTIKATIAELEALDEVQYFTNMAEIRTKDQERTKAQIKLDEVLKTKTEAQNLQAQINEICKGETLDSIKEKYQTLSQERKTISEISTIDDSKAIQRNEIAFLQLQDYANLTNIQYSRLISMIEVDDII